MERFPSPEEPERYKINTAQEEALRNLCHRYGVEYRADDYYVYPPDAGMTPSWAEGWVGGYDDGQQRLYVGVSPEGEIHS
ncbi:hypothetical protein F6X56_14960 [Rhodococcus erythropolis]|uniref:hypothetical protein n=1 Tax=Rhodococcus erythropolis group TaxID=2840174 RepID=UPI001246A895|nr:MULTISPECIES: hypothetical protein [Rhodococcus erythropolis group]MBW4818730.1 hypothetical protein [Rhodococcus qingshengii]QEX10921.1 hypothetical protein F6X56_14960 [Rhodococcus erythropolis]